MQSWQTMMSRYLLNCDMGEGEADDAVLMPYLDLANIACGFHASDPQLMAETVQLALQHGVQIGAHPSYRDRVHFGRVAQQLSSVELEQIMYEQITSLRTICQAQQTDVAYLKPHGALYHQMMRADQPQTLETILQCMQTQLPDRPLIVMAVPHDAWLQELAVQYNVPIWREAFADRRYQDDGSLLPRTHAEAVLQDPDEIIQQIQLFTQHQQVKTDTQNTLSIQADTLCLHGDNPAAALAIQGCQAIL